jgi:hypothetical protein
MWESKYALKRLDRLDPQHLTLGPRHHTWGMPRLAEKTPSEPQLQQLAGCSRVGFLPYTNRQHGTLNGASRVWRHVSNIVQLCFELKSFKVHGWRPVPRSPTSRACLRLDSQDITSAHLWTTSITGISSLGSPLWLYITRLDTPLTENAWNKLVKLNLKPPNAIHDKLRKFAQSISSLPLGLHVFLIVTYECQKVKVNQHYAKDPSIKKR